MAEVDLDLRPGDEFIFANAEDPPAVWQGQSTEQILWAAGEPLMLFSSTGVGKTTLAGRLVLARLGIGDDVLGFPVRQSNHVVYVAADRPRQIGRSFRRMIDPGDEAAREVLNARLRVFNGPLPFDLSRETATENMRKFIEAAQLEPGDTLVLDSMKDLMSKLSGDEAGANFNRTQQVLSAHGIDVLNLHHTRKDQVLTPKNIDAAFGSTLFTAGQGSVLFLKGSAGDHVVELRQLKAPAEFNEPLKLRVDHGAGQIELLEKPFEVRILLKNSGPLTVEETAREMFGVPDGKEPTSNQIEKARYQLKKAVKKGQAEERAQNGNRRGGKPTAVYAYTNGEASA
jgi:hypothetical protein